MPITQVATLASNNGTTWFSTASRTDAVEAAITGIASPTRALVTNVGRLFPFWPELAYYPSDASPNPQYVWESALPEEPETIWFAQAVTLTLPTVGLAITRLATADVFSDNTNTLFLEEYLSIPAVGLQLFASATPVGGAPTGAMQAASPPYEWQTVRKFSNTYLSTLPVGLPLLTTQHFVVSIEAANFPPNGPVNPAGLQYIVELYNDIL
ncbi:hypothetical protein [Paenibacillus xerothermodurans]|uniref:Uncharacterized protein n=1 Tax=Paenibacillus xerothermodurans TaxID=1977292 RepID=A0A2W1N7M5_PAEXE|nr:hypothetical protein [Paenibacillus xerothermodurans]PZE20619.1 hypothetical protein CBW46_012695 [Paenibacillus xerothermodurans]